MNKKYIHASQSWLMMLLVMCVGILMVSSCKEDEQLKETYFKLEDEPTGLSVGVAGSTQSYVVRSNGAWEIVAQEENEWVKAFPAKGDADGIFKITVSENATFDQRVMNFSFVVDGEEQPTLFRVEQEANIPYVSFEEEAIAVQSSGGEFSVGVKTNVNWTYTLEDVEWLTAKSNTETTVVIEAEKNNAAARSATLTLHSDEDPGLEAQITITQARGSLLLFEDFSWLSYGSEIPYVTTGETRFDSWTEAEQNHGWSSTPNEFSSLQQVVYARQGFVKLGKTKYGGDMITQKFDIEGTVTLKVTFKAAVYISAGGTVDDNLLKVAAMGAGTASVDQFIINNTPNNKAQDDEGIVNDIWAEDRAYTFTVTGATSETQIQFLGGDFALDGVGKGKNRIFLDDIKIEIAD